MGFGTSSAPFETKSVWQTPQATILTNTCKKKKQSMQALK